MSPEHLARAIVEAGQFLIHSEDATSEFNHKGCVISCPLPTVVMVAGPVNKVLPLLTEALSVEWGGPLPKLRLLVEYFHDDALQEDRYRMSLDCSTIVK